MCFGAVTFSSNMLLPDFFSLSVGGVRGVFRLIKWCSLSDAVVDILVIQWFQLIYCRIPHVSFVFSGIHTSLKATTRNHCITVLYHAIENFGGNP